MKSIVKQNHQFTTNVKRLLDHYSVAIEELADMFDQTPEYVADCIELRDNFSLDELLVLSVMFNTSLEDLSLHKDILKARAYQKDQMPNAKQRHTIEELHRRLLTQLVVEDYSNKQLNTLMCKANSFYSTVLKNDEEKEVEE